MVCPTCYCYGIEEEVVLLDEGQHARRDAEGAHGVPHADEVHDAAAVRCTVATTPLLRPHGSRPDRAPLVEIEGLGDQVGVRPSEDPAVVQHAGQAAPEGKHGKGQAHEEGEIPIRDNSD